jgi:very-short-patch-repair endonuclease
MDEAIRTMAERQYGVISLRQLRALGLSEKAIRCRVQRGLLLAIHPGVYAVGHRILTGRGHLLAAVLAAAPGALLSHRSAGAMWQLLHTSQSRVDVTVPGNSRHSQPGIRVHRARHLHSEEISAIDCIPVTSVPRTIMDLAGILRPQQELEVIEQANRLDILNFAALHRAIDRRPNIKGATHLRHILNDYTEAPDTRSKLERDFLALITKARLPKPQLNHKIGEFTVDVYWPQWRLVVEIDGRGYHLTPRQFENDRIRDAKLQRLGIRVLRITEKRMKTAPAAIIEDIHALAALAG